jgi:hypothetical protein
LRTALARQSKAELVNLLLEIAREDRAVLRKLTAQFEVAAAPNELVAATRQAIADATDFDERDINYNFDYDYEAYKEVKRNLGRVIAAGQLPLAMQLSLELMKAGSYQVEMSDEGDMTQDIEDCLSVVIKSVKKSELPAEQVIAWCAAVRKNDRLDQQAIGGSVVGHLRGERDIAGDQVRVGRAGVQRQGDNRRGEVLWDFQHEREGEPIAEHAGRLRAGAERDGAGLQGLGRVGKCSAAGGDEDNALVDAVAVVVEVDERIDAGIEAADRPGHAAVGRDVVVGSPGVVDQRQLLDHGRGGIFEREAHAAPRVAPATHRRPVVPRLARETCAWINALS